MKRPQQYRASLAHMHTPHLLTPSKHWQHAHTNIQAYSDLNMACLGTALRRHPGAWLAATGSPKAAQLTWWLQQGLWGVCVESDLTLHILGGFHCFSSDWDNPLLINDLNREYCTIQGSTDLLQKSNLVIAGTIKKENHQALGALPR